MVRIVVDNSPIGQPSASIGQQSNIIAGQPSASIPLNAILNTLFPSARCSVEHANGMLKARSTSLKGNKYYNTVT